METSSDFPQNIWRIKIQRNEDWNWKIVGEENVENFHLSRMKTSEKIKFENFSFSLRSFPPLNGIIFPECCRKTFSRKILCNIFARDTKTFFLPFLCDFVKETSMLVYHTATYGHIRSSSSLLSTKLNSDVAVNARICFEHWTSSSCPHGTPLSLAITYFNSK